MNSYADLTTLKSDAYLNISSVTDYDTQLRKLLEHASRLIDKYCMRFFYCWEGTRYYPGAGSKLFLRDDILSITTLKTDDDGDGTFENSLTENTDYFLFPLNEYPKIRAEINPNGSYGSFANGIQRGVEIAGVFGYGDGETDTPYEASGINITVADATSTTVTVSVEGTIAPGHTIRVESEQMYVTAATSDGSKELTVKRAVNGTTGAAHSAKEASIYQYPQPIVQACLVTCMRAFKRKDSAFQDIVGSPETGQMLIYKGLDPDVRDVINAYRKVSYP